MEEIKLTIDGREITAQNGQTVFQAAAAAGIHIPSLCFHEQLEPYGGCRVCSVEVVTGSRSKVVASCVYPASNGLVVNTNTEKIRHIRKVLIELLLTKAPASKPIRDLAEEYGADTARFSHDASFCILCGLCVRYCAEVKKANALCFISRGTQREVTFVPEIANRECEKCQQCFDICPTNFIRANFEMAKALTFGTEE
jgi:NADH dehydrogenase/NADH:ubiquinone oxidoreductase subunit G